MLSDAIQGAVARGLPIDNLSSHKRDYTDRGKLAPVVGRVTVTGDTYCRRVGGGGGGGGGVETTIVFVLYCLI